MHNKKDEGWILVLLIRAIALPIPLLCYFLYDPIGELGFFDIICSVFVGLLISYSAVFLANSSLGRGAYLIEIAYFVAIYVFVLCPGENRYPFGILFIFYLACLAEGAAILVHAICYKFKKLDLFDDSEAEPRKERSKMKNKNIAKFLVPLAVLIAGIVSSVICYNIAINTGYDRGYSSGYDDGYVDGYTDGDADGYDNGYDDGYADGEDYGYDRGYDAGHDSGVADSYTPSTYSCETYIGNANSYKFHRESCSYLPADWNQVFFYSREDAVNAGYDPCQKCNP